MYIAVGGGMDKAVQNSKPMIQQSKQLSVVRTEHPGDTDKYQNAINYYLVTAVVITCILLAIFYVFHNRH